MQQPRTELYPLPVYLALEQADSACSESNSTPCLEAALNLADTVIYLLGASAVARYTQATYTGEAATDPTLNRSLRTLRRVLPGQWLGWTARALVAVVGEPLERLGSWYSAEQKGPLVGAYSALLTALRENLGYTGEYGRREAVSPRLLLELIDQFRIRRGKAGVEFSHEDSTALGQALLGGLKALLASTDFFTENRLFAPNQRQLLVGAAPTTPKPPIIPPAGLEATLVLYSAATLATGGVDEKAPLFPLDPLLVYIDCPECGQRRVAALQEVVSGVPSYRGLAPDCLHLIRQTPE